MTVSKSVVKLIVCDKRSRDVALCASTQFPAHGRTNLSPSMPAASRRLGRRQHAVHAG
ncbi:MAG TPA: hypothetical protein VGG42_01490 [Acidobacteriaceae bacterium]